MDFGQIIELVKARIREGKFAIIYREKKSPVHSVKVNCNPGIPGLCLEMSIKHSLGLKRAIGL